MSLTVAQRTQRIQAILAGRPVPPMRCQFTEGGVVVITDPDPDTDHGYRLERADYDPGEDTDPAD